jgi:hypothetical protein
MNTSQTILFIDVLDFLGEQDIETELIDRLINFISYLYPPDEEVSEAAKQVAIERRLRLRVYRDVRNTYRAQGELMSSATQGPTMSSATQGPTETSASVPPTAKKGLL